MRVSKLFNGIGNLAKKAAAKTTAAAKKVVNKVKNIFKKKTTPSSVETTETKQTAVLTSSAKADKTTERTEKPRPRSVDTIFKAPVVSPFIRNNSIKDVLRMRRIEPESREVLLPSVLPEPPKFKKTISLDRIKSIFSGCEDDIEEDIEFETLPSGRKDRLAMVLNRLPETAKKRWDKEELSYLVDVMKSHVDWDISKIEREYEKGNLTDYPAAYKQLKQYEKAYNMDLVNGEYEDEKDLAQQYKILSRYLTTYKTGTAEGAVKFESEEFKRIADESGIYSEGWEKGQRSAFWKEYRRITEHPDVQAYVSRITNGKQYMYGSDIAQTALYDIMNGLDIYDYDKASDYLTNLMRLASEDKEEKAREFHDRNKGDWSKFSKEDLERLGWDDEDDLPFV